MAHFDSLFGCVPCNGMASDCAGRTRRVVRLGSPGRSSSSCFGSCAASWSKHFDASMGKVLHVHSIVEILHEYVFGHSNNACVLLEGNKRTIFPHCLRLDHIPLCRYLHTAELVCYYFLHGSESQ